jgi:hypothetical protein
LRANGLLLPHRLFPLLKDIAAFWAELKQKKSDNDGGRTNGTQTNRSQVQKGGGGTNQTNLRKVEERKDNIVPTYSSDSLLFPQQNYFIKSTVFGLCISLPRG